MAKTKKKTKLRKSIPGSISKPKPREAHLVLGPQEMIEEVSPDRIPETPLQTETVLETTEAQLEDRVMRHQRNPVCPSCGTHPVICMMRRPGYKKFRCRACGHQWEVFE